MALGTVPLFQGMPVWNPVLRNAFGWTAGQMSWAFAVTRIEGGILGPLEGILIERLGLLRPHHQVVDLSYLLACRTSLK